MQGLAGESFVYKEKDRVQEQIMCVEQGQNVEESEREGAEETSIKEREP